MFQSVFDPSVAIIVSILSQVCLVLLIFLIGLQLDFGLLLEKRGDRQVWRVHAGRAVERDTAARIRSDGRRHDVHSRVHRTA